MTQPGVTQHIKKLESYYKAELIERHGKQFELTPAGHKVYQFALEWLGKERDLKEQLVIDDPFLGSCRLASPGALSLKFYPRLLAWQACHPELSIHFEVAPNQRIIQDIIHDRVDLGWVTSLPDHPQIQSDCVGQMPLCLVTPGHLSGADFSELQTLGFINHPDGFHHAELMLSSCYGSLFQGMARLKLSGTINQLGMLIDPVAEGLGFTVVPQAVVDHYPNSAALTILTHPDVKESVYQIRRSYKPLAARYEKIIELSRGWV